MVNWDINSQIDVSQSKQSLITLVVTALLMYFQLFPGACSHLVAAATSAAMELPHSFLHRVYYTVH